MVHVSAAAILNLLEFARLDIASIQTVALSRLRGNAGSAVSLMALPIHLCK